MVRFLPTASLTSAAPGKISARILQEEKHMFSGSGQMVLLSLHRNITYKLSRSLLDLDSFASKDPIALLQPNIVVKKRAKTVQVDTKCAKYIRA